MNPGPRTLFELFDNPFFPITDTLIVSWVVVLVLIILAKLATRNMEIVPGRVQNIVELIVSTIEDQIEPMLPGLGRKLLPFIGTIFIFVGVSNILGIVPGVANPTGDINTTLGLALVVFLFSHYYGVKNNGLWGYLKSQAEPIFIMLPINIVGELAKPISHSFRLFGNIVGGGLIVTLVYQTAPWLVPLPFHAWFDLFIGAVQALIFGMVAIAYISVAKSE